MAGLQHLLMQLVSAPLRAGCCAWFLALGACAVDAHIYRAVGEAADRSDVNTAGAAAQAGLCSAAAKLLSDAESGENQPRPCESDEDCRRALFAPACSRSTGLCVPCSRPGQIATVSVRAGLCIGANAERCCRGQASIADCLVNACASDCGDN